MYRNSKTRSSQVLKYLAARFCIMISPGANPFEKVCPFTQLCLQFVLPLSHIHCVVCGAFLKVGQKQCVAENMS